MREKIILAALSLTVGIFNIRTTTNNSVRQENIYSSIMVVNGVDIDNNIVSLTDCHDNEWQIKGVEDWQEGDVLSCIMKDNATDKIEDDKIYSVRYETYIF